MSPHMVQILGDRPHQIVLAHHHLGHNIVSCTCGATLGQVRPEQGPEPVLIMHRAHVATVMTG